MGKSKYSTVVAAVLAVVVLFSPLLCGTTCLEGRGVRPSGSVDVAAPVLVESGLVGCFLARMVLDFDLGEWVERVDVGRLVCVGVELVQVVRIVDWVVTVRP